MGVDSVDDELKWRLKEATADLSEAYATRNIALKDAYQTPGDALRRMQEHFKKYGQNSLLKALSDNPEQFGVRCGHPLTRDGWRENASARERHAKEALLGLAQHCAVVVMCEQRVAALEESLKPQPPTPTRTREKTRSGPER